MCKTISRIVCLVMLICILAIPGALSAGGKLTLPSDLQTISEEAFMGNTSVVEVIVPTTTDKIEARAFSGCTKLQKVTLNNKNVQIAADAFSQCGNVKLRVYSGSTGETFAKQHGINYELIDPQTSQPIYAQVKAMIGLFSNSGSGLQGGDDRLIVRMNGVSLPDISEYDPATVISAGRDTYFVQFNSEADAANCKAMIEGRSDKLFVEYDSIAYAENRGEDSGSVSQAGILTWQDNDPMGFDTYAPYVVSHQSGSQMIAIIDTGVKDNQVYRSMLSDLSINMLDDGQGAFYSGRNHASYIASIIHDCVGNTNVKLLSVRAVDDQERTDSILFGQSIAYAVDVGADIINISYLFPYSKYVENEIKYAVSKGVKVIISAGNQNGSTSEVFPANANVDDLIVVSGLDDVNSLWPRTNTGPEVTYCAPASGIRTSIGNVGEGTSFAAPMIASAYALVSLDSTHSIKDMRNSCKTDISTGNKSQAIGYGMPQLHKLAAVKVAEIVIDNAPTTLGVGKQHTLTYTVKPDKAMDKTVSYSSSDTAVLTIQKGTGDSFILEGVGKGKSTVTLTANDGSGVTKKFDVQVVQPVTKITLTAEKNEVDIRDTLTINLKVAPSNANNTGVNWSSSNPDVATVSQDGVVTPKKVGSTVIRADANDGYGAHADLTINVGDVPDPESITILAAGTAVSANDTLELKTGEEKQLTAKITPENANQAVTWSVMSIPSGAVTIDGTGKVKAVAAGTAFVTATSTAKGTVQQQVGVLVRIMPTNIAIDGLGEVNVGSTINLTATVTPSDATNKTVVWKSSNNAIATVSQSGVVKGVSGGEVTIEASAEANSSVKATKSILVKQMPTSISITGTKNIFINNDDPDNPTQNASQLTATVTPSNTYDKSVTWSSSNNSVAKVSSTGRVTTVGVGTTTITAKCVADPNVKTSVTITVKNKWGAWTDWKDDPITETGSNQVETRTLYQGTTTSYGNWGGWSRYQLDAISSSDTTNVESATVWAWLYFPCPNCGFHMWANCCECAGWAGGCNKYFGATGYDFFYLPISHYDSNATWNFGGVGSNRVRYYDSTFGFGWIYGQESDHTAKTGYRYRTRSKDISVSDWQTTPIEPVPTGDYLVTVTTKTQYRSRTQNTF